MAATSTLRYMYYSLQLPGYFSIIIYDYFKVDDGILFCRIITLAVPDTIDERVVNKGPKMSVFKKHENLTVAITSAQVCARHIYQ